MHDTSDDPSHDCHDLHTLKKLCQKNGNNHEGFVLRQNFHANDIPGRFRGNEELGELLKLLSRLTVKISVFHRSPKRQDSNNENDCNTNANIGDGWNGSGRIQYTVYSEESIPGNLLACVPSATGRKSQRILVQTSNHLVYDQQESEHTVCLIEFDGPNSNTVHLSRCVMLSCDSDRDLSVLAFETEDIQAIESIKTTIDKFKLLSKKLQMKYSQVKDEDKLCAVISHPHGCYKYISFGTWQKDEEGYYTYTAKTCPASSGGSVFLLGVNSNDLVHMGSNSSGRNCSSFVEEGASKLAAIHNEER